MLRDCPVISSMRLPYVTPGGHHHARTEVCSLAHPRHSRVPFVTPSCTEACGTSRSSLAGDMVPATTLHAPVSRRPHTALNAACAASDSSSSSILQPDTSHQAAQSTGQQHAIPTHDPVQPLIEQLVAQHLGASSELPTLAAGQLPYGVLWPSGLIQPAQKGTFVCAAAVMFLALTRNKELSVLLVKQDGKYGIPGGKTKQHETALDTASREVEEETHWQLRQSAVRQLITLDTSYWWQGGKYVLFYSYLPDQFSLPEAVQSQLAGAGPHPEAVKIKGAEWLTLSEIHPERFQGSSERGLFYKLKKRFDFPASSLFAILGPHLVALERRLEQACHEQETAQGAAGATGATTAGGQSQQHSQSAPAQPLAASRAGTGDCSVLRDNLAASLMAASTGDSINSTVATEPFTQATGTGPAGTASVTGRAERGRGHITGAHRYQQTRGESDVVQRTASQPHKQLHAGRPRPVVPQRSASQEQDNKWAWRPPVAVALTEAQEQAAQSQAQEWLHSEGKAAQGGRGHRKLRRRQPGAPPPVPVGLAHSEAARHQDSESARRDIKWVGVVQQPDASTEALTWQQRALLKPSVAPGTGVQGGLSPDSQSDVAAAAPPHRGWTMQRPSRPLRPDKTARRPWQQPAQQQASPDQTQSAGNAGRADSLGDAAPARRQSGRPQPWSQPRPSLAQAQQQHERHPAPHEIEAAWAKHIAALSMQPRPCQREDNHGVHHDGVRKGWEQKSGMRGKHEPQDREQQRGSNPSPGGRMEARGAGGRPWSGSRSHSRRMGAGEAGAEHDREGFERGWKPHGRGERRRRAEHRPQWVRGEDDPGSAGNGMAETGAQQEARVLAGQGVRQARQG